jgi:hypothetical protein
MFQRHHKFPQRKWARRLYGKLLDDSRNIQMVSANEHAGHNGKGLIFWTEKQFCEALGIEMRSKAKI